MFLVKKGNNGDLYSLPVKELDAKEIRCIGSTLAVKILQELSRQPMYPKEIADKLGVHEQKIYYHINQLRDNGIIEIEKTKGMQGAQAKYYKLSNPSFEVRFRDFEKSQGILEYKKKSDFLNPFIEDGKLDSIIIVGSPDPHGPSKARAKDSYFGIDFALFLGSFLNTLPTQRVKLDTEVHSEELRNNLIVIGGPAVNMITTKLNDYLPIRFGEPHWSITSDISGKNYTSDEVGLIVKHANPFDKSKQVLLIAGKKHHGTRAAIMAFMKHFSSITEGNMYNNRIKAKVVEGMDMDGDGIIDDIEVKE